MATSPVAGRPISPAAVSPFKPKFPAKASGLPAYLFFLAAHTTLILRPQEAISALDGIQFFLPLILLAIVASAARLHYQVSPRMLIHQPVNLCVIGVFVAVILSQLSHGQIGLTVKGAVAVSRLVLYYLVFVATVTTPNRLKGLLAVTACASVMMIALSIADFRNFSSEWNSRSDLYETAEKDRKIADPRDHTLRHVVEFEDIPGAENAKHGFRMRGYGIYSDPNDCGLLIVITTIILISIGTDRTLGGVRHLSWPGIAVLLYGLFLTQSRGALLAGAVAGSVFLVMRYGKQVAFTLGALALCALPVVGGRLASISISGGTGQERIQLWSEGLQSIQNKSVFFGIGWDQYQEMTDEALVAHNSYIHAFTELGLFGGALFFGMFFFPAYAFWQMKRNGVLPSDPALLRLLPIIPAILAGWCMGMCSLSRCYTFSTYVIAGLCASYVNLVGFTLPRPRPVVMLDRLTAQKWALASCALLAGAFVFVKTFVRF